MKHLVDTIDNSQLAGTNKAKKTISKET